MFIGHAALGFAGKKWAPKTSLGSLIFAATFADVLWPVLVLAGVEKVAIVPGITKVTPLDLIDYPWSHSLLMLCAWGALIGGIYFANRRYLPGAVALALLVVSHWVLDWITHRPDMPLVPGGREYGLGLWNSVAGTAIVEAVMWVGALYLYTRATRPGSKGSTRAFWGYVALYTLAFVSNFVSPPPPNVTAVAVVGILASFTVFWAHWFDKGRPTVSA